MKRYSCALLLLILLNGCSYKETEVIGGPIGIRVGLDSILGFRLAADEISKRLTVTSVVAGGGAENAGIKVGDEILKIDNKAVKSVSEVHQILNQRRPGMGVAVEVQRDNKVLEVQVVVMNPVGSKNSFDP